MILEGYFVFYQNVAWLCPVLVSSCCVLRRYSLTRADSEGAAKHMATGANEFFDCE